MAQVNCKDMAGLYRKGQKKDDSSNKCGSLVCGDFGSAVSYGDHAENVA